eukprot:c24124_g1_i2 orf=506-1291(-)
MLQGNYQYSSPRANSDGGGICSHRELSSRSGGGLVQDIKNAPSFHHAIRRLLPNEFQRRKAIFRQVLHLPDVKEGSRSPPRRECLCDKERRYYRKDWRIGGDHLSSRSSVQIKAPLETKEAERLKKEPLSARAINDSKTWDLHFKSCTLYLEVKLAEMMSSKKQAVGTVPDKANPRHFRACWQLLGEICTMKTPFARVLSFIHQELNRAIHSSHITSPSASGDFEHELNEQVQTSECVAEDLRRKLTATLEALERTKNQCS